MSIKAIIYLPLDPEKAKRSNLPIKLPILVEDFPVIVDTNQIPIDIVIRGLEAQCELSRDQYYESYLVYFYYEKVKISLNSDDLESAQIWLEKVKRFGEDYRYDFFKGLIASKLKNYELAEIFLRSSVSKNEKFVLGHYELGNILRAKRELEDAILEYQKAFELDNTFLLPLLRIGDCYMELGEIRQACDFYQTITQLDPQFSQAYSRLGVACNILQRYEYAEKSLKKALEIDPKDSNSAFNLAHTLSKLGKHFEAMGILKQLVNKEPQNSSFLNEYALTLRRLGFYEQAKEIVDQARQIDDNQMIIYNQVLLTFFIDRREAHSLLGDLSRDYREKIDELVLFLREWDGSVFIPDFMSERVKKVKSSMDGLSLDVHKLAHFIKDGDRIEMLKDGFFPVQDTLTDTVKWLDIILAILLASAEDPFEMEKNVTKATVAMYGSGIMLAVGVGLTRLLFHVKSNKGFELSSFINDVVPDLQEYHWNFAKRVSKLEEESFSFEDLDFKVEKGSDFFIELLKALSTDLSVNTGNKFFEEIYSTFRAQWR